MNTRPPMNGSSLRIKQIAEQRGFVVEPHGRAAWRVHGRGIDIVATALCEIMPYELDVRWPLPWPRGGAN